jgi:hypothetical protein
MNQEIYNTCKYNPPDILPVVSVRRAEWLGQGVRMNSEKTVKNLLESKPVGGRKLGRPRQRWMDNNDNELDLKKAGVKGRKTRALDRTDWCVLWGKPSSNVRGCSAEIEDEEQDTVTLHFCLVVNVIFITLGIVPVKFSIQVDYESRPS